MDDFKAALEKQMRKATASMLPPPKPVPEAKSQVSLIEEAVIAESKTEPELTTTRERQERAAARETVRVEKAHFEIVEDRLLVSFRRGDFLEFHGAHRAQPLLRGDENALTG